MKIVRITGLALIAAAQLLAAPAALADYRGEYKLYTEAFNRGDLAKAIEHGEAAWRAAEEELGDHATTAILAFNYANLISPYAPSQALKPYERALALTKMGHGSLDVFELELRTAETRLTLDIKNRELGDAIEPLLREGEAQASPPPLAMALGWKTFAIHKSQRNKIDEAKDAGDFAIKHAKNLDPADPRLLAESYILGATLRLATPYRTEEDIYEMVTYLDASFPLFPPQQSIDTFDRLLARAMQLRAAATALAESDEFRPGISRGAGSRVPQGEDLAAAFNNAVAESNVESQVTWAHPRSITCPRGYVWEDQPEPDYPRVAQQRLYTGAVIIGYDMSETGVDRAIILADADEAGYGDAVVKALKKWKLAQTVPPECRKNHLLQYRFIIKQY